MYQDVAQNPHGEFHFEMGRALAERLGYRAADLDRIPAEAIDSFAGVGYYFHLLDEMQGARVLDLGSGSGMDSFIASLIAGPEGTVVGLDMTDAQRAKAEALRQRHGVRNITYVKGYIDALPFEDGSFDVVISNGVINLMVDKPATLSRDRPRAASRRAPGHRRHRHRRRPARIDFVQHRPCGRPASAAPGRSVATSRRSRPPGCASLPSRSTTSTASCPTTPRARRRSSG